MKTEPLLQVSSDRLVTHRHVLAFCFSYLTCVCGVGGGSSYFFQSKLKLSEIPGGPTYVIRGGGG